MFPVTGVSYAQTYQRLLEQKAIVRLGECGAFVLAEGDSDEAGVTMEIRKYGLQFQKQYQRSIDTLPFAGVL